jgi:hypothetical protein
MEEKQDYPLIQIDAFVTTLGKVVKAIRTVDL